MRAGPRGQGLVVGGRLRLAAGAPPRAAPRRRRGGAAHRRPRTGPATLQGARAGRGLRHRRPRRLVPRRGGGRAYRPGGGAADAACQRAAQRLRGQRHGVRARLARRLVPRLCRRRRASGGRRALWAGVASECIYDEDMAMPLVRTMHRASASGDGTVCLLAGIIGGAALSAFRREAARYFEEHRALHVVGGRVGCTCCAASGRLVVLER